MYPFPETLELGRSTIGVKTQDPTTTRGEDIPRPWESNHFFLKETGP